MEHVFTSPVFVIGNGTSAYKIISQARWTACGTNIEELGKWTFEPAIPEIEDKPYGFRDMGYRIVIAGTDFGGGGKSNDHPVLTLIGANVQVLIAESINRIFFRNALNLGMPALICPGILDFAKTGDLIRCNIETGLVENLSQGTKIQAIPLSGLPLQLIQAGGLLNYCKMQLQ